MKKVYEFIATGLYIGYFPAAPGTFGSLTAAILVGILHLTVGFTLLVQIICIVLSIVIGLVATASVLNETRDKDPGYVVIDEWAGQFITLSFVPINLENLIVGFVFFRIFDILKIFPIKNAERLRGAYGVMTDDLIAGLYAGACLYIWHLYI